MKLVFVFMLIIIFSQCIFIWLKNKELTREKTMKERFKCYYNLLSSWIYVKENKVKIEKYFYEEGYSSVAIYGMGEIGQELYEELKNSNLEIKYCIDKNYQNIYSEFKVCSMNEKLEKVDVIVVTPVYDFKSIKEELKQKVKCNVISLEEVIEKL